ncbi:hypothetical protein CW304_28910 [Bacillus sp. UFRGS-B20]|nr:hypothetical protein CW304_28910 [Bacillus sp. UFRGS-B20]
MSSSQTDSPSFPNVLSTFVNLLFLIRKLRLYQCDEFFQAFYQSVRLMTKSQLSFNVIGNCVTCSMCNPAH